MIVNDILMLDYQEYSLDNYLLDIFTYGNIYSYHVTLYE